MEEEADREEDKTKKSLQVLEKRRHEMVKKSREKTAEEVKRLGEEGASDEQLKVLQQKHQEEVSKLTSRMEADKLRMTSELREKLAAKREQRRKAKREQVELEMAERKREMEAREAEEREKMQANIAKTIQETVVEVAEMTTAATTVTEEPQPPVFEPIPIVSGTDFDPTGEPLQMVQPLSEEQVASLLLASPLYHKLESIKSLVLSGAANPRRDAPTTPVAPGEGYLDEKDKEWKDDKELIPLRVDNLDSRAFVVYKFGQFVCDMLAVHCRHKPVTLLLAERVPANAHFPRNAYRNSFAYDKTSGILYVRRQRLDSVGEFVLVLVHTLAHMKINDFRDDGNADFVREFHRGLSVCCDDMFFARYRRSQALNKAREEGVDPGASLLDGLYGQAHTEAEKSDVVEDLLDLKLLRGTMSDGAHFAPEVLFSRMAKYSGFSQNAKLRQYLGLVEEKIAAFGTGASAYVERRLNEMETKEGKMSAVAMSDVRPATTMGRPTMTRERSGNELWGRARRNVMHSYASGKLANLAEEVSGKQKDLYKHFLELQANELETRVDNLDIEYAAQAREIIELSDTVKGMEQELSRQNDRLKAVDENSEEHGRQVGLIRELTGRLTKAKHGIATVEAKKAGTLKRMEEFKAQLETKQQALKQYVDKEQASEKFEDLLS